MASRKTEEFLRLARERFKQAEEAEQNQRERERADLRTYAGNIWSEADLKSRGAQPSEGILPPMPARVSFNISLLQEPIGQVINEERSADLGVEIAAADDFEGVTAPTDQREIEVREGLVRRIQRESEADDARSWAFQRSTIAGRGYWGVMTRYLPGKTWDQEIYVRRFYDQASVLLDPMHEQPDGSDAEWAFVATDLRWDQYKAEYGERNEVATASADEFRAFGDEAKGWFRTEGETRIIRVSEYWYTEREIRELVLTAEGVFWRDELPDGATIEDRRTVIDKRVKFCKIDGRQILDETDWPTSEIPIIKELGHELQPYDAERRAQGMVRPGRDSEFAFNAMVSKLVESVGLTPLPSWQATIDQVQGFEPLYQAANTRALPVLYYNHISDHGEPLGPPTRTPIDTPVAAIANAIQLFRETIQATTGVHDPQLGRVDPSLKSGRAIRFLQEKSQHATSGFLSNHQRSVRREGHIINNLLYPIYGKRPGRLARIITTQGEKKVVALNGPATGPTGPKGQQAPSYPLTEGGNFNVVVKVGRTFDSRRAEQFVMLGDLLSSNPIFMTWFGDYFFEHSDWPGHLAMAERAKVMLDPKIQQMMAQKQQGMSPDVQQQVMPLMARLQDAEKLIQQMAAELQGKTAEHQLKLQIAQMETEKDLRLREMQDATALAVAKINAMTKGVISDNEMQMEQLALAHEHARTMVQQQHEERLQDKQQGHDVAIGAAEKETAKTEETPV
jgi:hypothetical protein